MNYLILAGAVLIYVGVLAHMLVVEPTLRRNGIEPRGPDDWLGHRDWGRYVKECHGSIWVFRTLWSMYISTLLIVATVFVLSRLQK